MWYYAQVHPFRIFEDQEEKPPLTMLAHHHNFERPYYLRPITVPTQFQAISHHDSTSVKADVYREIRSANNEQ